jgi:subfamily B ATP-binding cassette protein MsbA
VKELWRLMGFVRPYWWGSLLSVVLILVLNSAKLGPAWFVKLIIDQAIPAHDLAKAALFIAALMGAAGITNLMQAVEMYLEQLVGQRVIYDLRAALYDHLQAQSMSFYDANQTGQLMSRVTNDVNQVQFFLTQGLAWSLNSFVTIAVNLAIMLYLDWRLTAVAMTVTPIIIYYQHRMHEGHMFYRMMQRRTGDLNVVIQENVTGIKLIQAFSREDHEATRFNDVNWDIRQFRLRASMLMAIASPGQEFATYLSAIVIIAYGGFRVMEGAITIGSLAAFYSYVLTMWAPVRRISMVNQMAQQAAAAGERIFEILDTKTDVVDKPDAIVLPHLQGRLEMEKVSFAYGRHPALLRDIDVLVEPGRTLALVGPSGSGKTTLINLIPRFYDVTSGVVRVDGVDVRDAALGSLRSQIGMVMQETFLFNQPIRENIRYGRSNASQEEVEAAAKAASAHDFIMELEDGYDTLAGERGGRLSGGQRQRIAIARAILVDPRILILDEATSSVDNRTDFLIRQALDRLMEGRTTIVIAHRLSTVQRAHQIAVMEGGRITARGTHAELLHTSPQYQHLYEIQFQLQAEGRAGTGINGAAPNDAGTNEASANGKAARTAAEVQR